MQEVFCDRIAEVGFGLSNAWKFETLPDAPNQSNLLADNNTAIAIAD